ncbi:MAG: TonB-dependent receptor plug domain-containing protein [Verrucomicrobiota bacterium]|nr:TonB-dependent receptor plug domain-containing protein [Verrucomicrobiota bacterium]
MDTKLLRYFAGFVALSVFSASLLYAQEEDVIVLDEVDAESVPIEESILATTRPITSVYGTDRSILDTPRNVNIISREQLDAISVTTVRDFAKLTSSSYTKSNFGAPTTPNLRGQEADLMINGIRRGHSINGNGVPINFNSVESVNIVKGPAGAIYGTSNYVGGYADLITKRAYFENGGSVKYSVGSYDQQTTYLDANVVVSDELAYRISIQDRDWEGFWDAWYDDSTSYYATFTWRPNDKYSLDVMGEYYKGNYTENWGVNRVTQELFDDGLYIPNNQTDEEYFTHIANLGNGTTFQNFGEFFRTPDPDDPSTLVPIPNAVLPGPGVANPTVASYFGSAGFATISPIDPSIKVPVNRQWKTAAPGDDSVADVVWLQAIQNYKFSDTLRVSNNTYFHYKDRHTFSSYHYSEFLKDNWSVENKTQFIQDFDSPFAEVESLELTYGLRLKFQDMFFTNHYFNEPVNFWDLTRGRETRVPDAGFAGSFPYVAPGYIEPRGVLEQWYAGENGDSRTFLWAPFIQSDFKLNDKLSVLAGYTVDHVDHKEGIPSIMLQADGTPFDDYSKTEYNGEFYNANVSVVYKPTDDSAIYATINKGEHLDVNTGGSVDGSSFAEPNTTKMLELGTNISLFDGKAYLGAAIFSMEYAEREITGDASFIETDGFEIELNYQPSRKLFATIGYSYLDSTRQAGFFASPYTIDRADETGGYYISPTFGVDGNIKFENPGVPEHLLNALVQYKFDNGFGVQANLVVWGEMNSGYGGYETSIFDVTADPLNSGLNDDDELELQSAFYDITANTPRLDIQYEIDAKIFYEFEDWRFELSAFNITDEENWDVNNSGYGNGSAIARPDTTYMFSAQYSW